MITAKHASKEDIDAVIYDPEIYERIGDDRAPPREQFKVPYEAAEYIGGYVCGKIASLFVVHHGSKMHYMVLKAYRKYARKLLDASFKVRPHRVYVVIPSLYRPVINFAKRYGFIETGVTQATYRKHGRLYNEHTLTYGV